MMKKVYLYVGLAVCAVAAAAGVASTTSQFQTTPQRTPPRSQSMPQPDATSTPVPEMPKVQSKVVGVSLERLRLVESGDLFFDIVNNTEKSILSVTVRSGNYSITYNSYGDEALIFPGFKSEDERFSLKNVAKNNRVTLTAVEFVDGELQGTEFDKEQFLRDRREKAEGRAPVPLPPHLRNPRVGGVKQ
ncbi:MAG TPA: hypothetical protein VIQ24_14525 [Pyrinomonadaceae bacterium]